MRHTRTVAFHTMGCKLNFSESSTLARSLEEAGYALVRPEDGPDVFVLNTCSVTENADKECRRLVRRFHALNPSACIVVVGCYAQLKPADIAAIPGVDLVLGAGEKFDLAVHLKELEGGRGAGRAIRGPIKAVRDFRPSFSAGDRTRAFLKVQDGCDYFCSFCTIPLARGRSRSGSIGPILAQARAIAEKGIREIVLTGVNIGDYRNDGAGFLDLITALDGVDGISRFRISSIEPNLCSDAVIHFVAESRRFAPHFHLPLQSGSDALLQRMRRRYDTSLYADRVQEIKRLMPHACIGADVITGTPGEGETEFDQTRAFIEQIPVDHLHVFTYSERTNTTAQRMSDSVPMEVRRSRTRALRALSDRLQHTFYRRHSGTVREVLFEDHAGEGVMLGFTDNYLRVEMPYVPDLVGQLVPVLLERMNGEGRYMAQRPMHGTEDLVPGSLDVPVAL